MTALKGLQEIQNAVEVNGLSPRQRAIYDLARAEGLDHSDAHCEALISPEVVSGASE